MPKKYIKKILILYYKTRICQKNILRCLLVIFPRNGKNEKETILFSLLVFYFNFQFSHQFEIKFEEINIEKLVNMSKMTIENSDDLFEIEISNNNVGKQLPISLFQDIEADLCERLVHGSSPEEDQTDRALEFIQNIVDNVSSELEGFLKGGNKKNFLRILSKIFTILLSVKADSSEKIIKIVKFSISTVLKTWSEQN